MSENSLNPTESTQAPQPSPSPTASPEGSQERFPGWVIFWFLVAIGGLITYALSTPAP